MRKFRFLAFLTFLTLTTSLFAFDQIVIEMNDAQFQGDNILNLKDLARRVNPGFDPLRVELREVNLMAKSKQGMAETYLQVGQDRSQVERIDGNPADYVIDRPVTYDNILLSVYGRPMGEWQLYLKGQIKIKRIVLFVERVFVPGPIVPNRLLIDYRGTEFNGDSILKLKQEINSRYPQMNLREYRLKKVIMMAKSKAGRGTATLFVNGQNSYPITIDGTPEDYDFDATYTYYKIILENTVWGNDNMEGVWQVHLKGNIKVESVVMFLERKYGNNW